MYQREKVSTAATYGSAMERETISKNRVSPKNVKSRMCFMLLAAMLFLFSAASVSAQSAKTQSAKAQTSGTYGDNLTWKISGVKDNYTLTISGTGAMPDYSSDAPWSTYSRHSVEGGYQQSNIKSLVIGNSVTSIGASAFSEFDALTSVTIPSSVTSIGADAFASCSSLKSVTIPNSVKVIGRSAFSQCFSLTSITVDAANPAYSSQDGILFNKNKTTLIQYPLQRKGAYIIPGSVTTIGDGAFDFSDDWGNGNDNLTSITIPNSVTSIGAWAFIGCWGLESVTIPSSVTSIGENAFGYCDNLVSFISKAVTPPALKSDFIDNTKITVYVPAGSVQAYRKANYWSNYNIVPDAGTPNTKITDSGVVINGVKWATRNVDEKGTFVKNPEDNGYHYTWKEAQTACPVDWRVPTLAELRTLLDTNKVRSEWTTQNGYKGRKFTDKTTGKNLFLPAAGFSDGSHVMYVNSGFYWSNTLNSLGCGSSAPDIHSSNDMPGKNLSVRCVAK